MTKILTLSFVLLFSLTISAQDGESWVTPKAADYPAIAQSGKNIADFVPKNFKVVKTVVGDLNNDKIADAAVHIIGTFKQFLNKNDGLGSEEYDTNPRVLIILFRDQASGLYKLAEQSNTFVISPFSPVSTEPFQGMSIKNGVLKIDFELWQSAGGWGATNASYKFKYIDNEFALIGADRNDLMRNTGETETRSYNFLTNRVNISLGDISNDKTRKSRWKTLKRQSLKTMKTFPIPFEWEIEKDVFI